MSSFIRAILISLGPATAVVTEGAQAATQAATQMATAVASGSPIGVSASLSGKIFSNIKYLNISYSQELLDAFETWSPNFITLGFQPEMSPSLKDKIVDQPLPYNFARYNVESSFLINFWQVVSVLIIVTLFYICTRFFEHLSKKVKKGVSLCKTIRVTGQNFLLTQLYSIFGDLIFYSILEWRSFEPKAYLSWLSLSIAMLLYIIMITCFCFHLYLLYKYQTIKRKSTSSDNLDELNKFADSHKGNQVLFRDFRDNTFLQQGFLFFFTLRDIALSLVFTIFYDSPFAQAWMIFLLNIFMILYLILKRPFSDKFDLIQQIAFEVLIFVVNASVFIMAFLDQLGLEATNLREKLCKGLIILCMIFSFVTLGFVVLKLVISIKYGYQAWKVQRDKKKLQKATYPLKTSSQSITQDLSITPFENTTNNSQLVGQDSHRQAMDNNLRERKYSEERFTSQRFELSDQSLNKIKRGNHNYYSNQNYLFDETLTKINDNFNEKIRQLSIKKNRILPLKAKNINANNSPIQIKHVSVETSNTKIIRNSPSLSINPLDESLSISMFGSNHNVDPQINIMSYPIEEFENEQRNIKHEIKKVPSQRKRTKRPQIAGENFSISLKDKN